MTALPTPPSRGVPARRHRPRRSVRRCWPPLSTPPSPRPSGRNTNPTGTASGRLGRTARATSRSASPATADGRIKVTWERSQRVRRFQEGPGAGQSQPEDERQGEDVPGQPQAARPRRTPRLRCRAHLGQLLVREGRRVPPRLLEDGEPGQVDPGPDHPPLHGRTPGPTHGGGVQRPQLGLRPAPRPGPELEPAGRQRRLRDPAQGRRARSPSRRPAGPSASTSAPGRSGAGSSTGSTRWTPRSLLELGRRPDRRRVPPTEGPQARPGRQLGILRRQAGAASSRSPAWCASSASRRSTRTR